MPHNRKQKLAGLNNLSVSQNFMTSKALLARIVRLSTITKADTVLEIGAGKGHLTRVLSQRCRRLYSIEIDRALFDKTAAKLSAIKNLHLIRGDFLQYPLPLKERYKVFANIPYSITTQIIDKLTAAPNPPDAIWVVIEKGAAKRFMGIPQETGKSLLLKPNWDMKVLYHFQRDDFHPKPSVDSVLLHLSRKPQPDVCGADFSAYKRFVAHSLQYGLWGSQSLLTKKQVSTALKLAQLPPLYQDRPTLYIQWLCLFRCYQRLYRP